MRESINLHKRGNPLQTCPFPSKVDMSMLGHWDHRGFMTVQPNAAMPLTSKPSSPVGSAIQTCCGMAAQCFRNLASFSATAASAREVMVNPTALCLTVLGFEWQRLRIVDQLEILRRGFTVVIRSRIKDEHVEQRDWQVMPLSLLAKYSKPIWEIAREQPLKISSSQPETLKSGTRHRLG